MLNTNSRDLQVATLFGNQAEQRKKGGREYLVVPGVPVQEQVMNSYLLPAEEIQAYINVWNGTPVSIGHAKANNGSVKVPEPDVPIIGNFYNVSWDSDNNRMLGEYWIDIETAMLYNDGKLILDAIHNGKVLETSTAYWADEEYTSGNFNGRDYKTVHRNTRPDHIAIFTDGITGACSIEDGCGVNRNMMHNGECGCVKHNVTGNLPAEGKAIWEKVYEANKDKGEETAAKMAWDAVKQAGYIQKDDKWVKKNNALPPFKQGYLPTVMLERLAFDMGYRTPEQLEQTRSIVEKNGITKAVWLQRDENGDYKILDGAHRVKLAHDYEIDQIPVHVIDNMLNELDTEAIYYEWEHEMDRSYLNYSIDIILNGVKHPWHKGRPGEKGGSTSSGTVGGGMSEALQDSIRAAGQAMGKAKGGREEGYQNAYLALKKAASIAKEEGNAIAYEKLSSEMDKYLKYAQQYKPKQNEKKKRSGMMDQDDEMMDQEEMQMSELDNGKPVRKKKRFTYKGKTFQYSDTVWQK